MDAAMVTAIAAFIGGPVAAAATVYSTRGATRVQREGGALTGYDNLTSRLVAERDKAEADQAKAEVQIQSLELEIDRLRLLVRQLGGSP
jgi:hypothetical protein